MTDEVTDRQTHQNPSCSSTELDQVYELTGAQDVILEGGYYLPVQRLEIDGKLYLHWEDWSLKMAMKHDAEGWNWPQESLLDFVKRILSMSKQRGSTVP